MFTVLNNINESWETEPIINQQKSGRFDPVFSVDL